MPRSWDLSAPKHVRVPLTPIQTLRSPLSQQIMISSSQASHIFCACFERWSQARLESLCLEPKFLISTSSMTFIPFPVSSIFSFSLSVFVYSLFLTPPGHKLYFIEVILYQNQRRLSDIKICIYSLQKISEAKNF